MSKKRLKSGAGSRVGCSSESWHNQLLITTRIIRGDEGEKSGKIGELRSIITLFKKGWEAQNGNPSLEPLGRNERRRIENVNS